MKHFDYVDWIFFKEELIVGKRKIEMEDHLYNCDKCLEIFLSIISEDEIENISSIIADSFTDNVIEEISREKIKTIDKRKPGKTSINFGYYVAVAAVTIILTTSGLFNNMVDLVPKISKGLETTSNIERPNLIHEYSETIVDKTSKFISNIEDIEKREIRRKENER